jgi:hypothetical protein
MCVNQVHIRSTELPNGVSARIEVLQPGARAM